MRGVCLVALVIRRKSPRDSIVPLVSFCKEPSRDSIASPRLSFWSVIIFCVRRFTPRSFAAVFFSSSFSNEVKNLEKNTLLEDDTQGCRAQRPKDLGGISM